MEHRVRLPGLRRRLLQWRHDVVEPQSTDLGEWESGGRFGRLQRAEASRVKVGRSTRQARPPRENVPTHRAGGRCANKTRLRKTHVPRLESQRDLYAAILKSQGKTTKQRIGIFSNEAVNRC